MNRCLHATSWKTWAATTSGRSRCWSPSPSTSSTSSATSTSWTSSWEESSELMAFRFLELKEGCFFAQLCSSGTIPALTQVASMMQEDPEDRVDPMARVFPRVTKCTFKKFGLKFQIIYFQNFQSLLLKKGPSGTLQTHDSLCVLPVNIINEVCHSPIS